MPAFWGIIAENHLCGLQVYSLSKSNYRDFVNEILLEIDLIEISFISSNWSAVRPHYLLNFGLEKFGSLKLR